MAGATARVGRFRGWGCLMRHLRALPLLVLLAGSAEGQEYPSIAGYRLGAPWREVGTRTMPCEAVDIGVAQSHVPAEAAAAVRRCQASDTLLLWFSRDTLLLIGASPRHDIPHPKQAAWSGMWDWVLQTLGGPDSVVTTRDYGVEYLTARWSATAERSWAGIIELWEETGRTRLVMRFMDCRRALPRDVCAN